MWHANLGACQLITSTYLKHAWQILEALMHPVAAQVLTRAKVPKCKLFRGPDEENDERSTPCCNVAQPPAGRIACVITQHTAAWYLQHEHIVHGQGCRAELWTLNLKCGQPHTPCSAIVGCATQHRIVSCNVTIIPAGLWATHRWKKQRHPDHHGQRLTTKRAAAKIASCDTPTVKGDPPPSCWG